MTTMGFGAVRLPKAAEIVAATLRREIISGNLQAGDALPPEDHLMAEMQVARTTLRESLRILESEGLITVRRGAGGGARVRTPEVPAVARYIGFLLQYEGASLADLFSARSAIEAPAVALLATRRDPEVIDRLNAALEDEAAVLDDAAQASRAHGRFHSLIVSSIGSETCVALLAVANRLAQQQADRFVAAHGLEAATHKHMVEAHKAHRRVVGFIAAGAADDAEDLWRRHLAAGEKAMLGTDGATTLLDLLD